jgi:predicted nuclease of restriction endonuclease-like (RecB) superfamily
MKKSKSAIPVSAIAHNQPATEQAFAEIVQMIESARKHTLAIVNTTLIDLYWQIGKYISHRIDAEGWGKGTVTALSAYIQRRQPGARGFSPQNLWRMRQFFETYRDQPKLSTLLRELPWSSNLQILTRSKRPEEREFYLRIATQQRWSVRETTRQIDSALFERAILNPPKVSTALRKTHPDAEAAFRDAYVIEFLHPPEEHREADLHKNLLRNMSCFLAEIGRDFCFAGSEVPVSDTTSGQKIAAV